MKRFGFLIVAIGLIGLPPVAAGQLAEQDGLRQTAAGHPFGGRTRLPDLLKAGYQPLAQIEGADGRMAYIFTRGVPYPTIVTEGGVFELDIDAFDRAFPVVLDMGAVSAGDVCHRLRMCRKTGECIGFARWCTRDPS